MEKIITLQVVQYRKNNQNWGVFPLYRRPTIQVRYLPKLQTVKLSRCTRHSWKREPKQETVHQKQDDCHPCLLQISIMHCLFYQDIDWTNGAVLFKKIRELQNQYVNSTRKPNGSKYFLDLGLFFFCSFKNNCVHRIKICNILPIFSHTIIIIKIKSVLYLPFCNSFGKPSLSRIYFLYFQFSQRTFFSTPTELHSWHNCHCFETRLR